MAARVSGGIFISYRRQETSHLAGRLYDRLADRFDESQVFIDVDAIEPGLDFAEEIFRAVTACTVLLAIIGPAWLTAADGRGRRRLDDPNDTVRLEIETALAHGLRVIPILVDGAVMPTRGDLPGSLANLAGRNALSVRHESFRADAGRLVTAIEQVLAAASGTTVVSGATLNERLDSAAEQLGSDKPTVRLAGVRAMAGLADDWEENRQTCIDMLCDYLRMPHPPDSGSAEQRRQFLADQEVRHGIIRVITEHLGEDARTSWNGKVFDFTGVILYGGDFSGARFNRGKVNFTGAEFKAGNVDFSKADFSGAEVLFDDTIFSGGTVSFSEAKFRDGFIRFSEPRFAGSSVYFHYAEFSGGTVRFDFANIAAGVVSFGGAKFSGGSFYFTSSGSSGGKLNFGYFLDDPKALATGAEFLARGPVRVNGTFNGTDISFLGAHFNGGRLSLGGVSKWNPQPKFDWKAGEDPPEGVSFEGLGKNPTSKALRHARYRAHSSLQEVPVPKHLGCKLRPRARSEGPRQLAGVAHGCECQSCASLLL